MSTWLNQEVMVAGLLYHVFLKLCKVVIKIQSE
jgi:hypothetical protein